MTIRFGTDGWRAVVGADFTPENVAQVAQAFADIYPSLPEFGKPVYIGYDRRNKSKESAELIASVLLGNHISVWLSKDYCPTPCVSWSVKNFGAAAGIMVTASHNPPSWNGIKFKESYGGAASKEFLAPIEAKIDENETGQRAPKKADLLGNSLLHYFDPHKDYVAALAKLVDLNLIKKANFKILYDAMYGAGSGFLTDLLDNQITPLHDNADPNFGGIHPEPIQPYVNEAMEKMKTGQYSICVITDGDADRIGAVDEKGNFVSSHQIFSLLFKHLVENRGMKGKVLKSISTTVMLDRLCEKYHLALGVTPIGFKYLSPAMKEPGILIAGEESGGIGMPHHICERDGLYCALLLLELMATRKQLVGELIADLQSEAGPCYYKRIDLSIPKEKIEKLKLKLADFKPKELAGQNVTKMTLIDGYHFALEDSSWLLIRPSGTEPLLRTYAEAPTLTQVEKLLTEAKKLVDTI